MAYFSNGSEGEVLDEMCCKCAHYWACPVYHLQASWNYEQFGEDAVSKAKKYALEPTRSSDGDLEKVRSWRCAEIWIFQTAEKVGPPMSDNMTKPKRYGWKDLRTGNICQMAAFAKSKEELFETSGFGAIDVDKPIKGCLAVEVERDCCKRKMERSERGGDPMTEREKTR